MKIAGLEEVGKPRRGLRLCPKCHQLSLELCETDSRDVIASRGAVVCTRSYECTATDCITLVRFYEVSAGIVEKKYSRPLGGYRNSTAYGGLAAEPPAVVEVLEHRIILKI